MGFLAKKFAKAYCGEGWKEKYAEQSQKDKEELQSVIQKYMEKKREEKQKEALLPVRVKENLKISKIILFTFMPLFTFFSIYNMKLALIIGAFISVLGFLYFFVCKWKKMFFVPLLSILPGIIAGFVIKYLH